MQRGGFRPKSAAESVVGASFFIMIHKFYKSGILVSSKKIQTIKPRTHTLPLNQVSYLTNL